jgi:hypothetical protein
LKIRASRSNETQDDGHGHEQAGGEGPNQAGPGAEQGHPGAHGHQVRGDLQRVRRHQRDEQKRR